MNEQTWFPDELTAAMLAGFKTTERGCTHPRVGTIEGRRFIAKCGSWSRHSSDGHVRNECVSDAFLRTAGLNVPPSREYAVDFGDSRGAQAVRLVAFGDDLRPLGQAWKLGDGVLRAKIRRQVVAAYPVQALVAGIDTFTFDNVRVDPAGDLWFVDNGASFDYRACGKRKDWFWQRADVDDAETGYLSLARHPHQEDLQAILGRVDGDELRNAAANVRFSELVRQLPADYRRPALMDYARRLDAMCSQCQTATAQKKGKKEMDTNKVKGMLWGLIVGDALGSPIQFTGKNSHRWVTEMLPCPMFGMPAGCWTDDGSMAMCVMDSFVRKGGYDLKDIGETFVRWLYKGYLSSKEGEAFDVGHATSQAVRAIAGGTLVNGVESSQGNGSIMRFAPSYLIARALGRPKIIREVNDLTHASKAVRAVCDDLASVLDEHLAGRRTTRGPGAELDREDVPNSGWSVDTLRAALWAFNTTDSFEDGMVAAVNLGGDSDSIGAVFGQIGGAYYGFDAIPQRWLAKMKDRADVDSRIAAFIDALDTAKD